MMLMYWYATSFSFQPLAFSIVCLSVNQVSSSTNRLGLSNHHNSKASFQHITIGQVRNHAFQPPLASEVQTSEPYDKSIGFAVRQHCVFAISSTANVFHMIATWDRIVLYIARCSSFVHTPLRFASWSSFCNSHPSN